MLLTSMELQCAICNEDYIVFNEEISQRPVSHGICEKCFSSLNTSQTSINDLINGLEVPILLVNQDGTIVSNNFNASDKLRKTPEQIEGNPGGDVVGCAYSDLPEGCGHTIHCTECTIRNSVMETFESEKGVLLRKAYQYIKTSNGTQYTELLISTEKIGDLVLLQIKNLP